MVDSFQCDSQVSTETGQLQGIALGSGRPIMTKYYLRGVAQLLNWSLALMLGLSGVAALLVARTNTWLGVVLFIAASSLLVGVIRRAPIAYLGLATMAFFGLAASMRSENFVLAGFDAVQLFVALYIRSRLVVRVPDRARPDSTRENAT
jgi:FtsH-binding integral membrane protein